MEVRPGYKQTEVGTIPDDWEVAMIGSLASFTSGMGISVATLSQQSSDNPIPVYGGNGIAGYTQRPIVHEPVVVIGRVGQKCGEVYLTEGPAWITDNALYPRSIYRALDVRFFSLALKAAGLNNVRNRNDLPLVTQAILSSVPIPFPPNKAEQEAIAEALSDADALIEALEKLLAKKRQVKQGAMQELLTGNKRLPGFPDKWVDFQLSDLGKFSRGKGIKRDETVPDGFPCIRYGEIYTHHNDYIRAFYSFIPLKIAKQSQRINKGDLLFTGSGETAEGIGKCVAFLGDEEAYAGGDVVIFTPSNQNSLYLGYLMNHTSIVAQKARMAQGDAIVHISAQKLGQLHLILPSIEEQTAIAEILSDMDAEIAALEAKLAKARQVKQGMMQELLTGRLRLV
jgi:type I restriction enzyme, S subunit